MRAFNLLLSISAVLLLVCSGAYAAKKATKEMKGFTADQVTWQADEKSGIFSAPQWGNPKTGPSAGLIKFPKGWTAPLHHHTADHVAGVIAGTLVITDEAGKEWRWTPGSSFTVPGKTKHATKCTEETDCVLFGYINGKDDMIPAQKTAEADRTTTNQ